MARKRILIVCTGNSARSQIAEGLIRHEAGEQFEVFSAGTHPSPVREEAIAVMKELGIDISTQRSKALAAFVGQEFDFVITVCDRAREECPVSPGDPQRLHWPFDDPNTIHGAAPRAPGRVSEVAESNSRSSDGLPGRGGLW